MGSPPLNAGVQHADRCGFGDGSGTYTQGKQKKTPLPLVLRGNGMCCSFPKGTRMFPAWCHVWREGEQQLMGIQPQPGTPHTRLRSQRHFDRGKGRKVGSFSQCNYKNKVGGLADNVWSEETNTSLRKDPSSNKPVLLSLNPTICTSLLHRGRVKCKGTTERRNSP